MSMLHFNVDGVDALCDMNYGNYSAEGLNYVPCIYKARGIAKALPYLLKYLGVDESAEGRLTESRFGRILIKANGDDEIDLWISVDAMMRGFSTGEVARQVALITQGILLCLG